MQKRIVFTGGPSGGKTSIIEIVQRHFGAKVVTVPEAATILYQGGFPRKPGPANMRHIQKAIYYVVRELEDMAESAIAAPVALCDRGTLDGMAYWPAGGEEFLFSVGSNLKKEFSRYNIVIHLRCPASKGGYQPSQTRIESLDQALKLDKKIEHVWEGHSKRFIVPDEPDFLIKVSRVMEILEAEIPRLMLTGGKL